MTERAPSPWAANTQPSSGYDPAALGARAGRHPGRISRVTVCIDDDSGATSTIYLEVVHRHSEPEVESGELADEAGILDELARVLHDSARAELVAVRAGFPAQRLPKFTTPSAFWMFVLEEARNGVLPGGVWPIVAAARALYPQNKIFARYLDLAGA